MILTGPMFRSMLAVMGNPITREIDAFTGWMSYASATRFGVARHWDHATRSTYRHGVKRRQRRSFHRYMAAARQGFYWWEIDVTFYLLKMLSWTGLIWDLHTVPQAIYAEAEAG